MKHLLQYSGKILLIIGMIIPLISCELIETEEETGGSDFELGVGDNSSDLRDLWVGTFSGTTDVLQTGTFLGSDAQPLSVYVSKSDDMNGYPGNSSSSYFYYIIIPSNYGGISNLKITQNTIKFSKSTKYPFEFNLERTTDSFGDQVVKGYLKWYQVTSEGELSLLQNYTNVIIYEE